MSRLLAAMITAIIVVCVATPPTAAQESIGYSEETHLLAPLQEDCSGTLFANHDDSFENGFCWSYGGYVPPYYGAFGESFDLGAGQVECGAFWFTQVGYYTGEPMDVYVWEGGVSGPPGTVLWMVGETQVPGDIAFWPDISQHDVPVELAVDGEFTVGFWVDFSSQVCQWYVAADVNGPGGYPWVCIAPGIGYPTGWQNPEIVWGPVQSLGFGVYFEGGASPTRQRTWGSIKALFE